MSLMNCPACKKEISQNAVSCPQCGEPTQKQAAPKKKTSFMLKAFITLVFLIAINSVLNGKDKAASEETAKPTVAAKEKTPEEIKQDKISARLEAKFGKRPDQSEWDGSYREVKRYLASAANDPDSIEISGCTKTSVDEKAGWIVGCEYRGKNAFGGLIKNSNWFVIKNQAVVKMLPGDSYK